MTQALNMALLGNFVNTSGQVSLTAGVSGVLPVANGGTNGLLPAANGGTGLSSPGTAGNVLTSNGTTWVSQASSGGAPSSGQVFTASGTFTVPAGVTGVKVTVIGGGGNGGSVTGTSSAGGGGGGGGTAIEYITGLTPGGTVAVTVGAAAGTSSFGAYCSATGGATAPTVSAGSSGGAGGAGGTGSGGNINLAGGAGSSGGWNNNNYLVTGGGGGTNQSATRGLLSGNDTVIFSLATGGAGMFGSGGNGTGGITQTNGSAGTGYGNGGSGGLSAGTGDTTGGAGSPGIVIVEW